MIAVAFHSRADAREALDRLPRRGAARRRALGDRALHEPRRHDLRLGLAADDRADRRRASCCSSRSCSSSGARPSRSCRSTLFRNRVFTRQRASIGFIVGLGALRRGHVPAALPADREGPQRRRRPGLLMTPMMAGLLITSIVSGQLISEVRALQAVPDRRHRDHGGRARAALAARGRTRRRWWPALHARARARARDGDAGARARGAERRRLRVPRRRHLRLDALPPDRRLDRRRGVRRDLRQPARGEPRAAASRRARSCRRRRTRTAIEHLPAALHAAYVDALTDALDAGLPHRRGVGARSRSRSRGSCARCRCKTTAQAPDIGDGFHALARRRPPARDRARALAARPARGALGASTSAAPTRAELDLAPPELWLLARLGERVPITEARSPSRRPRRAEVAAPLAQLRRGPRRAERRHDRAHRRRAARATSASSTPGAPACASCSTAGSPTSIPSCRSSSTGSAATSCARSRRRLTPAARRVDPATRTAHPG